MDNRTFDDFDAYAKNYRAIHTKNVQLSGADSFYFAEMRVKMLQAYETDRPLKVLDLGCGDGVAVGFINRYFPQWQMEGIDVSEKSIEVARQQQFSNAVFSLYDGLHIPYDNNSFDIIIVAGVLHHVAFELHAALLAEMHRVLKPSGRLYIYEHNPVNPLTRYLVKTCVFDEDAKLLRCTYLKKQLKALHFKQLKAAYFIFLPPKGWLKKLVRFERFIAWLPLGGKYWIRVIK